MRSKKLLATFLNVDFYYDSEGTFGKKVFPKGVDTKGKICVRVTGVM